jgi:hypothetical protein
MPEGHLLDINKRCHFEVASYPGKGKYPGVMVIDSDGSHVAVSISEYETYGMSFENSVLELYRSSNNDCKIRTSILPSKGFHHLKSIK